MTPNQIGVLATEGESETLEFKKTTGERRKNDVRNAQYTRRSNRIRHNQRRLSGRSAGK